MKQLLIASTIILISITSVAQYTNAPSVDYLKKSNDQKLAAWLSLSTGIVVMAISAIDQSGVCIGPGCQKKSFPVVPFVIGGAGITGSIPLFISASRNRKKAAASSVSFRLNTQSILQKNAFVKIQYPEISFKVPL